MIEERKDLDLLIRVTESTRHLSPVAILEDWIKNPYHKMYVQEENVGLATFEYPGLYNVHWFFKVRGREAVDLAREMLGCIFDAGAETVRGLIHKDLRASKIACRWVGLKSYGKIDDKYELFCMTKNEYKGMKNG